MIPGTFIGEQHGTEKTGRYHEDGKAQRFLQIMPVVLCKRRLHLYPAAFVGKYPDGHRSHDTKRLISYFNHCLRVDKKLLFLFPRSKFNTDTGKN